VTVRAIDPWVRMEVRLIPVQHLFESHLNVTDLQRSMSFFGQTLGLELAEVFWERRVAFYWIGGRGNSMLGLWEVGTGSQRLSLHIAFSGRSPGSAARRCASSSSQCCSTRLLRAADRRTGRAWMDARCISVFS
jgi:hypothetical protein